MTKYNVNEEFGILGQFSPPFNKAMFSIADLVLTNHSKYLKSDEDLEVIKQQIKTDQTETISLYIYEPKKIKTDKVFLYFHGGAFVYEGNVTHYKNCRRYALEGECKVVYVNYRRAPKYPYPIPGNDCFMTYKWIIENAGKLKIDTRKIIIGGDSAGGCLAVDTVLKVIQENLERPCYQLLIYPVLDKRMKTKSMKEYIDTPLWNAKLNRKMWKYYLKGLRYISPSEVKDLRNMPPTYLETAEYDCLHDEGMEFAVRLKEAGVDVILNETKGTMHGFDQKNCPTTEKAILSRIKALKSIK